MTGDAASDELQLTGMSFSAHIRNLLFPAPLPGLAQLDRPEQLRLEWRALGCFLRSGESLRMLLYLAIWVLAGCHVVWWTDRPPTDQIMVVILAWPWLWLWTMHARRRCVHRLLSDAGGGGHVSS